MKINLQMDELSKQIFSHESWLVAKDNSVVENCMLVCIFMNVLMIELEIFSAK